MLPRMTALNDSRKEHEGNQLFNVSLELTIMAAVAMACGIAAVSKEFTPIFFGAGFTPCVSLIIVLAPVLVIKSLSQVARMQVLIPQHKETIFIESVVAGAIVNFIVNFIMINKYGAMGAVIGTLTDEAVTCFWQYIKIRDIVPYRKTMLKSSVYIIIGLIMIVVVRMSKMLGFSGLFGLLIEILIGGLTFILLCGVYWIVTKNPLLRLILKKNNKI